jgi:hypothetical protein
MNDPELPRPPASVTKPVKDWLERQLFKLVAMLTAIFGGTQDDATKAFAWTVAVLLWLIEIWHSRRANKYGTARVLEEAASTLRSMAEGAKSFASEVPETNATPERWLNYAAAYNAAAETLSPRLGKDEV